MCTSSSCSSSLLKGRREVQVLKAETVQGRMIARGLGLPIPSYDPHWLFASVFAPAINLPLTKVDNNYERMQVATQNVSWVQ